MVGINGEYYIHHFVFLLVVQLADLITAGCLYMAVKDYNKQVVREAVHTHSVEPSVNPHLTFQ